MVTVLSLHCQAISMVQAHQIKIGMFTTPAPALGSARNMVFHWKARARVQMLSVGKLKVLLVFMVTHRKRTTDSNYNRVQPGTCWSFHKISAWLRPPELRSLFHLLFRCH